MTTTTIIEAEALQSLGLGVAYVLMFIVAVLISVDWKRLQRPVRLPKITFKWRG